jgi:single-stranded DNA-binding protein
MARKASPQANTSPQSSDAPPAEEPAQEHIFVRGEVQRDTTITRLDDNSIVAHVDVKPAQVLVNGVEVAPAEGRQFRASFWGAKAVQVEDTLKAGAVVELSGAHEVRSYRGQDGQTRTVSQIKNSKEFPLQHSVISPAERIALTGSIVFQPELKQSDTGTFYTQVTVEPDDKSLPRQGVTFYDQGAKKAALELNRGDRLSLEGRPMQREWNGKTYHEVRSPKYEVIERAQQQTLERGASR